MTVRLPSSWNALIAGHTRVGAFAAAENLFAEMPDKTIISWTAMISGYCQNGLADRVTVVSVLPAWAPSAALEQGERIHRYPSAMGFDRHPTVQIRSLGCTQSAETLPKLVILLIGFQRNDNDVIAWNTMIAAYPSHGHGLEAVSTLEDMLRGQCSHRNVELAEIAANRLFELARENSASTMFCSQNMADGRA
ncbi:hypothetical protein BHM03_00058989 [Ensete ventricosum]|nr:hypothetical protein BHM03_00058989 [Ensete ventricosum]